MFSRFLLKLAALRGLRADLAAFALGALTAAALPPVHVIPLLLVSVPGLLALLDGASGPAAAARRGWWFGFGLHLFGLYWITEAILFEADLFWWLVPLAVPATAAGLAVFIAAATALARCAPRGAPRVLALAGAWVLADIARQLVLTGFPWNPLGSVWEMPGQLGDVFIQPAAWVGVHGLTLATLLLAGMVSLGWCWRLASVALLAGWTAFGLWRQAAPLPVPPGVKVILVQGNVAQGQKWSQPLAVQIFQRYLGLTEQGVAQAGAGPRVVVWPETAFPGWLDVDQGARQAISQATQGSPALIGGIRFDAERRPRNSLFALDGDNIVAVYDKWHLVPFGEYIPSWLPLPLMVLPGEGFAPGPGPQTSRVPSLPPVGVLICYEAIFTGQIVDAAERPAWLVNVTNDAWFGNSSGPRQHLAAARMRAVEEGLPLMRAANTGISAGFDPRGHEIARLGMQEAGTLAISLPAALPPTPYSRLGLWLPCCAAVVALGFAFIARRFAASG
jgi:apolipoprotein N-acyltransferase